MKADLVIKNGVVCTDKGMIKGGIAAKDGIIIYVGSDDALPECDNVYDAKGLLIMPGAIEPHCHLGLDKKEDGSFKGIERYTEDVATESKAAVVGGVTTINTTVEGLGPGGVRFFGVKNKMDNAKDALKNAYCDIKYYLGVADDEEVKEFNELRSEGLLSCAKVFLGFKGEAAKVFGHPEAGYSTDFLYRASKALAEQNGPVQLMVHCEDAYVRDEISPPIFKEEPVCGNYIDVYNRAQPGFCEAMDLCKMAYITNYTNCPLYIVHISAKETCDQLDYFLQRGYNITGETCLHYLMFATDDAIAFNNPDWNNQAKVSPPIRTSADRDALWNAILNGTITCVGTDHTNYSAHTNKLGGGSFWDAPGGCGDGMSLLFTAVFSEGVHKRNMSVPNFCKLMSENPAKALGIYPQKGALIPGADLDAVIFDPNEKWNFKSEDTYSTHVGSIYEGLEFKGKVKATFVRGTLVAENGKIVVDEPVGKFVKNSETKY